jgi:hypothetical protein
MCGLCAYESQSLAIHHRYICICIDAILVQDERLKPDVLQAKHPPKSERKKTYLFKSIQYRHGCLLFNFNLLGSYFFNVIVRHSDDFKNFVVNLIKKLV